MSTRTQAQRARVCVWELRIVGVSHNTTCELETIIDEAQNEPPDGAADGTISPEYWAALRDLVMAAKRYRAALVLASRLSDKA